MIVVAVQVEDFQLFTSCIKVQIGLFCRKGCVFDLIRIFIFYEQVRRKPFYNAF